MSLELQFNRNKPVGGHSWPGGRMARAGADPLSELIDASDLIWDFFSKALNLPSSLSNLPPSLYQ